MHRLGGIRPAGADHTTDPNSIRLVSAAIRVGGFSSCRFQRVAGTQAWTSPIVPIAPARTNSQVNRMVSLEWP